MYDDQNLDDYADKLTKMENVEVMRAKKRKEVVEDIDFLA